MDLALRIILYGQFATILVFIIALASLPLILLKIRLARNRHLYNCIQCGTCCRIAIVPLDDEDIKRIEEKGYKDFWVKKGREKVIKRERGKCIFLKDNKCSIHEFKPKVCTEFPFFKIYGITYCRIWMSCPAIEQMVKDVKGK